jgi:hypothetical protein
MPSPRHPSPFVVAGLERVEQGHGECGRSGGLLRGHGLALAATAAQRLEEVRCLGGRHRVVGRALDRGILNRGRDGHARPAA